MTTKAAALERERTERYNAYLKIVSDIGIDEDPFLIDDQRINPIEFCRYCQGSRELFDEDQLLVQHNDKCIWMRCKELIEKEN